MTISQRSSIAKHTVVNISFTFPFSTNRSAGWTGKNISPTMRQHSLKQNFVPTVAATFFTTNQHTHSDKFVPLASPVENSEFRSTCAARPSNIAASLTSNSRADDDNNIISPSRCRCDFRSTSRVPARLPSCCIDTGRTISYAERVQHVKKNSIFFFILLFQSLFIIQIDGSFFLRPLASACSPPSIL